MRGLMIGLPSLLYFNVRDGRFARSFERPLRKWRNWQTRKPQELVGAIPWGFESPLPHQFQPVPNRRSNRGLPLLPGTGIKVEQLGNDLSPGHQTSPAL